MGPSRIKPIDLLRVVESPAAPFMLPEQGEFGVDQGERHQTMLRSAAWLTEQGAPPSLCSALLTEAGRDVGLTPKDVERQIQCGIEHARRQQGSSADPPCDTSAERWAMQHEADPLPPDALSFPFGANALLQMGIDLLRLNESARLLVANVEMSPALLVERIASRLSAVPLTGP